MRPRRSAAALSIVLGAAGCSEEHADPPDEQSELVDLYLDEDIEACAGQLPAYDRFLTRAFDFWAGGVPPDFRAAVHVAHEPDCGRGLSCASGRDVWLGGQFGEFHELAHLVHANTDGWSAIGLNEGVAQALAPGEPLAAEQRDVAYVSIDTLFAAELTGSDYGGLALLTRFLIDRYGIDAFRAYFRALRGPRHPEPAEFESEFEVAFGERLDDVWPVFTAEPRCGYDFWFCDDPAPVELPFVLDGIDCDAPTTQGFEAPGYAPPKVPYSPMTIVHVAVDRPVTVQLGLDNVMLDVGRCGVCSAVELTSSYPEPLGAPPIEPITEVELEPGTYAFIVRQFDDGPVRFSITEKP